MKSYIITALIFFILGIGVSYVYFPNIVEKPVEKIKVQTKTKTNTVIRKIIKPDGTKEITKTIKSQSEDKKEREITPVVKNWHVSIQKSLKADTYNLNVERKIMGPFFINSGISTDGQISLGVGFEF